MTHDPPVRPDWFTLPEVELEPFDSPDHPVARWFGNARRERRAFYAEHPAPSLPRSKAIITMVRNESIFLPIWLDYYSRWFAPDEIFVFDNDSSDGSTDREGFVRIPAPHDCVEVSWMRDTIQALQHELIAEREIVMVTDVDELVTPLPGKGTLGDYLDRFGEEWVNCLGYELVHMRGSEPPFDPSRTILSQRHHWFANGLYDKPLVTTVPMRWQPGFHRSADDQYRPDPDLRLIHLHRMDYDICRARHAGWVHRPYAAQDRTERWGLHNQTADEPAFERWFYNDGYVQGGGVTLETLPDAWNDVL